MNKKFTKFTTEEIDAFHERRARNKAFVGQVLSDMDYKKRNRPPEKVQRIVEKAALTTRQKKVPVKLATLTFLRDGED